MARGLRKLLLTAHIAASVGWLGAVAAFLALAVAALTGRDERAALGAYPALDVIARWVILPCCLASLVTGILQSLATPWGLFRHYWVVLKLLITLVSTAILLLHLRPIGYLAGVAAGGTLSAGDMPVRVKLVVTSGAAIVALLLATVLSAYKPRGLTPYGLRNRRGPRLGASATGLASAD